MQDASLCVHGTTRKRVHLSGSTTPPHDDHDFFAISFPEAHVSIFCCVLAIAREVFR
jgi:hypothetical protein